MKKVNLFLLLSLLFVCNTAGAVCKYTATEIPSAAALKTKDWNALDYYKKECFDIMSYDQKKAVLDTMITQAKDDYDRDNADVQKLKANKQWNGKKYQNMREKKSAELSEAKKDMDDVQQQLKQLESAAPIAAATSDYEKSQQSYKKAQQDLADLKKKWKSGEAKGEDGMTRKEYRDAKKELKEDIAFNKTDVKDSKADLASAMGVKERKVDNTLAAKKAAEGVTGPTGFIGPLPESPVAKTDNKIDNCGYIGKDGTATLKTEYKQVGKFSGGYANFQSKDGKWGFINKSGAIVVQPKYNGALDYNEEFDLVAVKEDGGGNRWDYISIKKTDRDPLWMYDEVKDQDGKLLGLTFHDGMAAVARNNNWGFLKAGVGGKLVRVIEPVYPIKTTNSGQAPHFSDGYAVIMNDTGSGKKDDYKYGYIDKTGKNVTPRMFAIANDVQDGYAVVQEVNKDGSYYNGKYGIIKLGSGAAWSWSAKPTFEMMSRSFSKGKGLVAAKKDDKWGYVNRAGQFVIPATYEEAFDFSEDLKTKVNLASVRVNGKYGFIDDSGKVMAPIEYEESDIAFADGFAAVKKNGAWGYINTTGQPITNFVYQDAYAFSDGVAAVKSNGMWGFIDGKGQSTIKPMFTDAAIPSFNESYAAVCKYNPGS